MRSIALVAVASVLTGCLDLAGSPSRDEVAFATSPDGALMAKLIETNGGATTSFGYEIEVLRAGPAGGDAVAAGHLYGATRSLCSYGVNLRWASSTELQIEFLEADTTDIPATIEIDGKTVEIRARPQVSDETAPCGGMLASRR